MKNTFKLTLVLCAALLVTAPAFAMAHTSTKIETERLILRPWEDKNIQEFYEIMQNPAVNGPLRFYNLNVYDNARAFAEKANKSITEKGYGYFACIKKDTGEFIGFIGLNYIDRQEHPFPCHTVSYTLAQEHWRHGYAQEAVKMLLKVAFEIFDIPEVYACTTVANEKSQRVMQRLGMKYVETFDFPGIDTTASHCKHVLYKIVSEDTPR